MKKRIISCCIAALAFVACDEGTPTAAANHGATPLTGELVAKKKVDAGTKIEPAIEAKVEPKIEPKKTDTLAIESTGNVDHSARAKQLESDGDTSGALTEMRRELSKNSDDETTLGEIARLAKKLGRHDVAAEAFGRLGDVRVDDAMPRISQARELIKSKAYGSAIVAADEAIERDRGNPEGWQAKGLGHLSQDELKDAIASFEKCIELKPDHGFALNNLGLAYLRAGENTKALEVLEQAHELLPNVAYVHNNYGVALERNGKHDEAKAAYQQASLLSPKYIKAKINLARTEKEPVPADPSGDEPETMSDMPDVHPMAPITQP